MTTDGNRLDFGARRTWAAFFAVIVLGLVAAGYGFYRVEAQRTRLAKYNELAAIGELKAGQIAQWRQERLNNASNTAESPFFRKAVEAWRKDSGNLALRDEFIQRLDLEQRTQGYVDALLLDPDGRILLAAKVAPHPVDGATTKAVAQAIAGKQAVLSDLFRCPDGDVHIDAVAPLTDADNRPFAVLVLRSNATEFLYPLIQSWPIPSQTAETVLVRKEGDDVLFLNDLRHQAGAALSLRIPLTQSDVPAVQAALGKQGMFEGKDYRGIEVLADLEPVPGSPWSMVAKVDASEILAEVGYRARLTIVLVVLSILLAAALVAFLYRQRQVRIYRALRASEREKHQAREARVASEARYRRLFESAKDGILILDAETGVIVDVNPFLTDLLGYSREQFLGKKVWELGLFKDILANQDRFLELQQNEYIPYEDLPLETADGRRIDVEFVSNVYSVNHLRVIQCNIRDVTERKRAGAERKAMEEVLRLLNAANDSHDLMRTVVTFLKDFSDCEAIGIRLRDGDDYPYFEVSGFPEEFVEMENRLCLYDSQGLVVRDGVGNPVLECMCGNILCGRFDPSKPFFTPRGSFWTNCTTDLLASTTEADRQAWTRNRCNGEGYESVALIPLRSDMSVLGLIQLNDKRKGRFTPALIALVERMADNVAKALAEKLATRALRESEQRYRTLFDEALDGMCLADAGTGLIIDCNNTLAALVGRERAELIGQSQTILHPPSGDQAAYSPTFRQHLTDKEGQVLETQVVTCTGIIKEVEIKATGVTLQNRKALLGVFRDVTERKRAAAEIESGRDYLANIVNAIGDPVFVKDDQHRFVLMNDAECALMGRSRAELIGKTDADFFPQDQVDVFWEMDDHVLSTGQENVNEELLTDSRTGKTRTIVTRKTRYTDPSGNRFVVGTIRDITEQKRAAAEREKLEERLRQSQKMEAVGQLAGGVAHDFNNLLQAILGFTELVQIHLGPDTPDGQTLGQVRKAAERAADLTRQLLAFSRRQVIRPVDLDLNEAVKSVLKMVRRLIGEHIELRFMPGGPLGSVHADRGQIEQVVMNLCVNARDAMPNGGTLTIETQNAFLGDEFCREHPWATEGAYVLLTITDTGHGMDEATRAQIFEPFFTTKGVGVGTGLGLATVYGIVKQHNGLIHVDSELGKGSAFKVYVPVVERAAELAAPKTEEPVVGGFETILVAEDEEMVRDLVADILQTAGYTVWTARDGEDALRVFEEHADAIDMAVLDVMMPKLSGRNVMDRIQAKSPRIRFLFSSGYSRDAIHTNFVIQRGLRLITKPYRREDLLRAVRETIDAPPSEGTSPRMVPPAGPGPENRGEA